MDLEGIDIATLMATPWPKGMESTEIAGSHCLTHPEWCGWALKTETRELINAERPDYGIDMDEITTSAELLDWIMQLHERTNIEGLVQALDDILHIQHNYCSFGNSLTADSKATHTAVYQRTSKPVLFVFWKL